ncbi:hypothetical protein BT96DRAFT_1024644 [Gymnopus androsaceus JB14]|uniref:PEBP-like protein n=1 Tax=Gymnopus androsaceus JB14 TaxID=1447944 RepID=A0A6A4GWR0_9AGAR|nr:hypothetical protein BT96DRAFT_1024644 [Gymnopus androsaceus JB14]
MIHSTNLLAFISLLIGLGAVCASPIDPRAGENLLGYIFLPAGLNTVTAMESQLAGQYMVVYANGLVPPSGVKNVGIVNIKNSHPLLAGPKAALPHVIIGQHAPFTMENFKGYTANPSTYPPATTVVICPDEPHYGLSILIPPNVRDQVEPIYEMMTVEEFGKRGPHPPAALLTMMYNLEKMHHTH